jgi:hypothetical protein
MMSSLPKLHSKAFLHHQHERKNKNGHFVAAHRAHPVCDYSDKVAYGTSAMDDHANHPLLPEGNTLAFQGRLP